MLGEAGSIASLAGLLVSLSGLGFALLQLSRLRGETRAASEETRRLLRRDSAGTDLTRIGERIQGLIEIHRSGDRARALDRYPEIQRLFLDIQRRHPNLTGEHRRRIQSAITQLWKMQGALEGQEGDILLTQVQQMNRILNGFQLTLLPELQDLLE